MQLYSSSEFSPMHEASYTVVYVLVSESAKTVMVRYLADTLYGRCNGKPFRAQRTETGIRWGGQRYGQSAKAISVNDAAALMTQNGRPAVWDRPNHTQNT